MTAKTAKTKSAAAEKAAANANEIEQAVASEVAPKRIELTSGDCQIILNIFDAAFSRGTFKGEEASSVGSMYDKIKLVIAQSNAEAQAEAAARAAAEGAADAANAGASA